MALSRRDWHFAAFQTQAQNDRSWVHSGQTELSASAKYTVNDPTRTCAVQEVCSAMTIDPHIAGRNFLL